MIPFLLISMIIVSSQSSAECKEKTNFPSEYRSFSGMNNNRFHRAWGAAGIYYRRIGPADYSDTRSAPSGIMRPNPRTISGKLLDQGDTSVPVDYGQSSFLWAWSQFIYHDMSLTLPNFPEEAFNINVPEDDQLFCSKREGERFIPLNRSEYINHFSGVRQQINRVSSFIDGSMIYGSDSLRANALRLNDGTGRLRTSSHNLLPFNNFGFENSGGNGPELFLAGDIRANENSVLTALHTLFVREHNFWCSVIESIRPGLSDYQIYQQARALVIAEIQAITYNEFLPALLGPDPLPVYSGYNPEVNPTLSNEFATAVFCIGHSMVNKNILRLNSNLETIPQGNISLRGSFFNIGAIVDEGNIDPILRGLAYQKAERVDLFIVNELRNNPFGMMDLAAITIQRGRDHGLPSYNQFRKSLGLSPVSNLNTISSDPLFRSRIAQTYNSIDDMDLWPALLAEDHIIGSSVGPTLYKVLKQQFQNLRDGDRFWYQSYLSPTLVKIVEKRNLARIIITNTGISANEIPANVFFAEDLIENKNE
jgi:hypothetical protein